MRILALISLFLPALSLYSQNNLSEWKTTTGVLEEKEFLGRKALFLSKGLASLTSSTFTDGVIEGDIATLGMAGLSFRIDSNNHYEEAYIRFPKSGLPDALQAGPVFNGEFSWQFFPEYQARVTYPANQWIHMKIIVEGDKAGVYMNNQDTAVILIDSLRTPAQSGKIGIWALNGAYFTNLRYRKAEASEKLPVIRRKLIYNKDAVRNWWISEPWIFTEPPVVAPASVSSLKWQKTTTDPDGYLNINRYAKKKVWGRSRDNSNEVVWLRHEWEESAAGTRTFSFDYSNMCFLFVNDFKIFAGNNSFLLKGSLFRGDIDKQMRANTVFLPVKKGKNILMIAVSGINNGWGFMGQFADGTTKKFGSF